MFWAPVVYLIDSGLFPLEPGPTRAASLIPKPISALHCTGKKILKIEI